MQYGMLDSITYAICGKSLAECGINEHHKGAHRHKLNFLKMILRFTLLIPGTIGLRKS